MSSVQRSQQCKDNVSYHGAQLSNIFDIQFLADNHGNRTCQDNIGMSNETFLTSIFKDKYRDQFEIDFENKILYRTVKSWTGYPSSIIDIKYKNSNKRDKRHPTTKPV